MTNEPSAALIAKPELALTMISDAGEPSLLTTRPAIDPASERVTSTFTFLLTLTG